MSLTNSAYDPPTIMKRAVHRLNQPLPVNDTTTTSSQPFTVPKQQWQLVNSTIQHLLYEIDNVKQGMSQHKLNQSAAIERMQGYSIVSEDMYSL